MPATAVPVSEPTQLFIERHWVFEHIQKWMTDPASPRYFLLKGEPGSGKSAIARRLAQAAQGVLPPPTDAQGAVLTDLAVGCLSAQHFCSARDSVSFDPRNFAHSLAGQLAVHHIEYALALKDVGDIRVDIQGQATAETATSGVTVAGVIIQTLNLNLAGLKPQQAFNRTVRDPLTRLYEMGHQMPITIMVDALDESLLNRPDVTIVDLLARLESLPSKVRFLLTSRRDNSVLSEFPQAHMLDISDAHFTQETRRDIEHFVRATINADPKLHSLLANETEGDRMALLETIVNCAQGNFLYVRFLLDALTKGQHTLQDLNHLPVGLDALYHESLSRVANQPGQIWQTFYAPLMGVLSVAQESLTRPQLQQFTQQSETQVWNGLHDLEAFLEMLPPLSDQNDGEERYQLYHQSFIDFLRRPFLNPEKTLHNAYLLPAAEWHGRIADRYFHAGTDSWKKWDNYGLRAVATHLAMAAQTSQEETALSMTERLVRLTADSRFQDRHLERLHDLPLLQRDLLQAVRRASALPDMEGCALTMEASLAVTSLLRERLRPEQIFMFARNGDLVAAERELGLYAVEPEWRQAALLMAAWLVADFYNTHDMQIPETQEGREALRRLRDRLQADLLTEEPLHLLLVHLNAALENIPLVGLSLPPPPEEFQVRRMIERIGGVNSIPNEALLASGLQPTISLAEPLGAGTSSAAHINALSTSAPSGEAETAIFIPDHVPPGIRLSVQQMDNGPTYIAAQDGKPLIAYVADNRPNATRYFQEYVRIHASNGYIRYRNKSLGFLLEAGLCHPVAHWAQEVAVNLLQVALAGGEPEFQEGLQIVLLALKARIGDTAAGQTLDTLHAKTEQEAAKLQAERELGDAWGHYKQRLAALAQAYFLLGDTKRVFSLLSQAHQLPFGFAGFQSTACLALVEAMHICQFDPSLFGNVLESARAAAHNIQDHTFCAQMTARVNAMLKHWWVAPSGGFNITEIIPRFCENPALPEFTPLHVVNDAYEFRSGGENRVPLPPEMRQANTLRQLAGIYRRPLADFVRLNAAAGWAPDTLLRPGTSVCVPDADFAPRLAARFSAQALSSNSLSQETKTRLIQSLLPIAIGNASFANTVLSRLFLAAQPNDPGLLDALLTQAKHAVASLTYAQVVIPGVY